MKILFIGGTGNISTASSCLAVEKGMDLWVLNRGNTGTKIPGTQSLEGDINDERAIASLLKEHQWDCVVNWIAFTREDVLRDIRLFSGKTKHYIFISSASCYQTPLENPRITEETPLSNPMWLYSRDKIACEEELLKAHKAESFPATIVRPSHTYSTVIPIVIGGWTEYTTVDRIKKGLPIVVHGDGTALWVLTNASDFAKGFCGLPGLETSIGEAFHITSDELLSWNQIHQQLANALGREANIVHVTSDRICREDPEYLGTLLGDKAASVIFDNSKIKRFVPEFAATIPFSEGIRKTLDWFETDATRQVISPESNAFIDRLVATQS